ncbi:EXS family protein/ERD1/XPR1/SYG1 family protein [Sanghuangporus baumii]|uniref:EXS family protein/ERD1/XPR1/SYG1 family protein n=1 Tax=Sanghuangporus baumii TaxID=108892 RepID=A0A9Q5NDN9_SANBA|nr:EXS family protein/ERD1/XPR1/SYG1 family protein [Sanghuangporus baumii]
MKFARYLQDTQTPEWKKAYIDYRGLKKLITAIKNAQENEELDSSPEDLVSTRPSLSVEGRRSTSSQASASGFARYGSTGYTPPLRSVEAEFSIPPVELPDSSIPHRSNGDIPFPTSSSHLAPPDTPYRKPRLNRSNTDVATSISQVRRSRSTMFSSQPPMSEPAEQPAPTASPAGFLANLRHRHTSRSQRTENLSGRIALPLSVILQTLRPIERKFIDKLDKELEKVEDFYLARGRDALLRASALKQQLRELEDHRKLFYEARAAETTWKSILVPRQVAHRLPEIQFPNAVRGSKLDPAKDAAAVQTLSSPQDNSKGSRSRSSSPINTRTGFGRIRLDPDEYKNAKKNLKKAILEYYRGLELLNNYRVLNLTGFRKALKKFEKTVKVPYIQQAYMQEKVESSAFASGATIEDLLKDVEESYAQYFEHGDTKKARERLRATASQKRHHFSTFRSGLYLGLAIPALADGIYRSFQPGVRENLPWDALLYVYATFLVPVSFALLVGINIWVWTRSRINYQFIFELDVRTQLDSREYFELPAFLLSTLIYAFWLSFAQIGVSNVAPTTWPIAWLAFTLLVLLDPLPIFFPESRWWLVRKTGKLLLSGTQPVEFTDFWLGDQFCSLIFTLSNLYFVGCVYGERWEDSFIKCSVSIHWGVPFAVGILPLVARAVQSVKRYADSHLYTHLINAGKYSSSILYYVFYYLWRHNNRARDYTLALFCVFGTFASIYTSAWDILMDWSFFKRPAQHPFLRKELVYQSNYWVYYFAIVSNIIIRFQWILYIPVANDGFQLRTFIVAMLEMLRRFQWNFFRLENEHIGNTDQYRVTREVPLPYNFDGAVDHDTDDEGEDDEDRNARFSVKNGWHQRSVRMAQLSSGEDEPPHTTPESRINPGSRG